MHVLVILLDFVRWSGTYRAVWTYVTLHGYFAYATFISFARTPRGNLLAEQGGDDII